MQGKLFSKPAIASTSKKNSSVRERARDIAKRVGFVNCAESSKAGVGLGGEFGLAGFGVEQKGLVEFRSVVRLDVDEALL